VEVKRKLAAAINAFLTPFRERRAQYEAKPSLVKEVIQAGTARARLEAAETMRRVRDAMGMYRLSE
jgi:tryptophanyl-tRNA synthetase